MTKKIIYMSNGTLSIITPSEKAVETHGIDAIAKKDVPAGIAYKVVDSSDVPSDRLFRDAWEVDESALTDGTGSDLDIFDTDPQHPEYVAPEGEDVVPPSRKHIDGDLDAPPSDGAISDFVLEVAEPDDAPAEVVEEV